MSVTYYIACEFEPTVSDNGVHNRCRVDESQLQTVVQVSETFQPPLSFEDANFIGMTIFLLWGSIFVAKEKAHLFKGDYFKFNR